ncbi:MAG: hypothetical protein DHS20C18_40720 [Saprospiraceae bacterium]|nr:MAG: hypothetical protein DHS20C18_40720 [Saprospiraceae bacterium]
MNIKCKTWNQFIPRPIEEVWAFFSNPENLNRITPNDMSFEIISEPSIVNMYPGMIIQYRVSPFWGLKMRWVTEITNVKDQAYFIDEQRFGPYGFWHHQHHFEAVDGGVMMRDILHYKIPYSIIGSIVDAFFVDKKIESIFVYREKVVNEIFPDKV